MADKPDSGSPAEGGAAAAVSAVDADENAALLAELEAEQAAAGGTPAAKPAKAAKPAPDPDDADDGDANEDAAPSEDDDAPSDLDDEDDEGADKDPDDEDDELAAAAGKDPELAKRLAAVRRTEQRQREQLKRDRETFDRERSDWHSQTRTVTEAQKRFETIAARAKYDPAGALTALGLTDADMEYAAQQVYARSPAAAKKEGYREAAERAMREREAADELRAARAEIGEVKKTLAERDQQAAVQRELDAYFGRAIRKVDDTTPRTQKLIASYPKRARAELAATALELVEKTKRPLPEIKPKELLAAHEKKIARRLRMYGIEDAAPAADPAAPAKPNGKKPAAAPAKGKAAKPAA